ncbi:MAG: hypothetical protein ACJ8KU_02405 [Chthoniobacterales bacterium]
MKQSVGRTTPVLLLVRGDFRETQRALGDLKRAGRTVAVSLKETGLHQIANQLCHASKLERFLAIVRTADACIGTTPEAADIYRQARGDNARVEFIPTPYPLDDQRWDFSRPVEQRAGIFVGTREFDVPSRNHLAALLLARQLSDTTGEPVTVYNCNGRTGERLIAQLGFRADKLRVCTGALAYPEYVRQIAQHKIVLQLDTSFVPGQVAGDAMLARVPCVGGKGAVDRIAFPECCGANRSIEELASIAHHLLTHRAAYNQQLEAMGRSAEQLSFSTAAEQLRTFFSQL